MPGGYELAEITLGADMNALTVPAPSGTYALRLTAFNNCGASEPAETTLTIDAVSAVLPGPPIGLNRQVRESSVTLQWSPPAAGGEVSRDVIELCDAHGNFLFPFDSETPAPSVELKRSSRRARGPPGDDCSPRHRFALLHDHAHRIRWFAHTCAVAARTVAFQLSF